MSFNYDATGIEITGNFTPAPPGKYNLVIKECKEKVTKNGDPMVSALCEIDDAGWLGTRVWHNVSFLGKDETGKPRKGAGMAVHFLKVIGESWEGNFEVNCESWVGKRFRAQLKVENDLKGKPRNEIAYIISPEEEVPF